MKILVTGATGFLGTHVVRFLKAEHSVIGLSRNLAYKEKKYSLLMTDYSISDLREKVKGVDVVIHLAAGRLANTPSELLKKNVSIDYNVFFAAYHENIKNIVFTSTRGVYGSLPIPWQEIGSVKPENDYSRSKLESEKIASLFNNSGLNIKILRVAQVLGQGEFEGSLIRTFIDSAKSNKDIIVTAQGVSREYIYIKDFFSAICCAVHAPQKKGIYNVGSGEMVTIREVADTIAHAFGKPELVHEKIGIIRREKSLMDSSLFKKEYGWKPKYSFKAAVEDIAKDLTSIDDGNNDTR